METGKIVKDLKTKLATKQSEVFPCVSKAGLQGRFAREVCKERGRVQANMRDETQGRKEEQQRKELEHQRKEIERIEAQISASATAFATYAGMRRLPPRHAAAPPVVRVRELQREVESRGDGQESRPSPQARERTRGAVGGRTSHGVPMCD